MIHSQASAFRTFKHSTILSTSPQSPLSTITIHNHTMSDMKANDTDDRLLLSLSHAPLPTPLLDSLINETSIQCNNMLQSIATIRKQMEKDHSDEKKDPHLSSSSSSLSPTKRNNILHVLATGTPYVIKPGKSQPDYIHQWTKGELILARLVEKIGMEKFHRIPKDGETKLAGRLIDVKPSDFEFILNHTKGEEDQGDYTSNDNNDKKWSDDCLTEELTWIANNILRILIIDQRPNIGKAKILFPLDPRFEHVVEEKELSYFIQCIFENQWSNAKGPLFGAEIEIMIVKVD